MNPRLSVTLVLMLWLPLLAPKVAANGGTFANTSVGATGHLVPQQKNRITLESERLQVRLSGDKADVDVEYQIVNHGWSDKVTYGFPIDSFGGGYGREPGVENYAIKDGGERLDVRKVIHEPANPSLLVPLTETPYRPASRDWYLSDLQFARGERKTLSVSYRQTTLSTRSGTSKSFRWHRSKNTFRYAFHPAQTWGNGRVPALRIELDVRALRTKQIPLSVVSPAGSAEQDGLLVWELKNVDLRTMPDLVVRYDLGPAEDDDEIRPKRLDRRMIESIRASSTLASTPHASYAVENVLDGRSDTAWIEGKGGTGKGEWIEITFKPGTMVTGIGVLNGYTKSPATLTENGHVRKLRLKGPAWGEASAWSEIMELQSPKLEAARKDWRVADLEWVFDSGESGQTLKKVRLVVVDAVPGTKFADTAISEIFIYGWKKRKNE